MTAQQTRSPQDHPISHRLFARENASGSNTSIIIAVVCGVVGGVILIFVLWQVMWKLCRPKRAPLPPIQPLVHHRQAHAASFADRDSSRPATWFEPNHLSVRHGSFPSGSDVSLIPSSPGKSPSRQTSFHTEETLSRRISEDTSMHLSVSVTTAEDMNLSPPNPPFSRDSSRDSPSPTGPNVSTSSLGSYDIPSPPPLSNSPQSSASALSDRRSPSAERRPRAAHSRTLSRPVSMASSMNTIHSTRSRSTIRGPPHARHSNVQIVLPAPLAPSMYREETDSEVNVFLNSPLGLHSRPATDSWIVMGSSRSVSQDRQSGRRHERAASGSSQTTRRSQSQRPDTTLLQTQSHRPPPVPRLPSEYIGRHSSASTSPSVEQHQYPPQENLDRGRQQRPVSQVSAQRSGSNRLQKQRSRSRPTTASRQSSYGYDDQSTATSRYVGQPQAL